MATFLPAGLNADQFMDWCCRPDHEDRAFELDGGAVVERRFPGTARHGAVCASVAFRIGEPFYRRREGYVLSNNAGFLMDREPDTVFCPDLMAYTTNPDRPLSNWFATRVPDLVVEVMDEHDVADRMLKRAVRFHAAGVPLVWLVSSVHRYVAPLMPGKPYAELTGSDDLTGNGVLPDFACKVADLFALPGQQPSPTA